MIEELLQSLVAQTSRCADALEAQVKLINGGLGASAPEKTPAPAAETTPPATAAKPATKKAKDKPAPAPEPELTPEPEPEAEEEEEAGASVEDVRAAYLVLTKATSVKQAKEVFDAYKEQVGKADSAAMTPAERTELIEQFQAAAI